MIRTLQQFSYEKVDVPAGVVENSGRELNAKYQEKLIITAVSYTHLDVYKRQVLRSPSLLYFLPSKAVLRLLKTVSAAPVKVYWFPSSVPVFSSIYLSLIHISVPALPSYYFIIRYFADIIFW